jgi:hypothetical protein
VELNQYLILFPVRLRQGMGGNHIGAIAQMLQNQAKLGRIAIDKDGTVGKFLICFGHTNAIVEDWIDFQRRTKRWFSGTYP